VVVFATMAANGRQIKVVSWLTCVSVHAWLRPDGTAMRAIVTAAR
jgi:hypothetical protein